MFILFARFHFNLNGFICIVTKDRFNKLSSSSILTAQQRFSLDVSADNQVQPVDADHVQNGEQDDVAPDDSPFAPVRIRFGFRRLVHYGRRRRRRHVLALAIIVDLYARKYLRERRRCGHRVLFGS